MPFFSHAIPTYGVLPYSIIFLHATFCYDWEGANEMIDGLVCLCMGWEYNLAVGV